MVYLFPLENIGMETEITIESENAEEIVSILRDANREDPNLQIESKGEEELLPPGSEMLLIKGVIIYGAPRAIHKLIEKVQVWIGPEEELTFSYNNVDSAAEGYLEDIAGVDPDRANLQTRKSPNDRRNYWKFEFIEQDETVHVFKLYEGTPEFDYEEN